MRYLKTVHIITFCYDRNLLCDGFFVMRRWQRYRRYISSSFLPAGREPNIAVTLPRWTAKLMRWIYAIMQRRVSLQFIPGFENWTSIHSRWWHNYLTKWNEGLTVKPSWPSLREPQPSVQSPSYSASKWWIIFFKMLLGQSMMMLVWLQSWLLFN